MKQAIISAAKSNEGVLVLTVAFWFSDPPNSGIGRYIKILMNAIPDALPLHYVISRGPYLESYFNETRIKGPFVNKLSNSVSIVANRIIQPHVTFSVVKKQTEISLIHYVSQHESPVLNGSHREIATIHDLTALKSSANNFSNSVYKKIVSRNIERIMRLDDIIAISHVVEKEVLELGFNGKIHTLHHCPSPIFKNVHDKISLRRRLNLPVDKVLIFSISTSSQRKNLGIVKETMRMLGDEYILIRVGPSLGLKNEIDYSNISDVMLNDLYNSVDVLLFPSTNEGFGFPLVEAMATGLPIVASDIPVTREVVGDSGFLVDKNESSRYAEAIKEVSIDLNKFIRQSTLRAELFTFEKFASTYQRLFSEIT